MTIKQIYDLAIRLGIEHDFRGKADIDHMLKLKKDRYEKLSKQEKQLYDQENFTNPFSDTRILWPEDPKGQQRQVKYMLVGIDIGPEEIMVAKMLGKFDLVMSHHPSGRALAGLDDVMHLQADVLAQYGVPIAVAQSVLRPRIEEVTRGLSPSNHNRTVDVARLLEVPYMCVHTPSDNMVAQFLKREVQERNPRYVSDVMNVLMEMREYQEATKIKAGPRIFSGSPDHHCGKIAFTDLTGGTEGSPEMYERLAQAGVSTIVGMHLAERHTEGAKKAHINAIVAGHMSSDSIGMNLFCDQLEREGIEIISIGGFIRVSRNSK